MKDSAYFEAFEVAVRQAYNDRVLKIRPKTMKFHPNFPVCAMKFDGELHQDTDSTDEIDRTWQPVKIGEEEYSEMKSYKFHNKIKKGKEFTITFRKSASMVVVNFFNDRANIYLLSNVIHWFMILVVTLIWGTWTTCERGFPVANYFFVMLFLVLFQVFEIFLLRDLQIFWIWIKSTRRCIWQFSLFIDALVAFLARVDAYTDIAFLWIAYACDDTKPFFVAALILLLVGVVLCQCCPTISYSLCTPNAKESPEHVFVGSIRGCDMVVTNRFLIHLLPDYDDPGTSPSTMNLWLNFNRFLFEDLGQAIVQLLYLQHTTNLSKATNIFVLVSVICAVILSCVRVLVTCQDRSARKKLCDWAVTTCLK